MSQRPYITCRQLIDFIGDYVAGELDEPSRDEFERHLERCLSCQAYLRSYRETMTLAHAAMGDPVDDDGIAEDVPEELVAAILRSAAEKEKR